jgi:beta-lactamase regulating signal transducer with metallopeptidase domain
MTVSVVQAALALTARLDLSIVVKTTMVLAFGLAALPLASRARASVRHLLMAATFGTVLVLPLVISTVPAVTVRVPLAAAGRVGGLLSSEAIVPVSRAVLGNDASGSVQRALPSLATLFRSVWAAGAMFLLALLAMDLLRLRTLRRGGFPWPTRNDLVRSLAVASGVHRPVDVLLHEGVSAPLTCGLWRPAILLPIDASDWHEADLRRALVHELEHVRRGDWATQLLARVVCACYWFHPLVWLAWGRLRLEAERACDDAVVQSAERTAYAEQLVSLARRMSTARALPSLAMANRTDLSARVIAVLDGTRRRGRAGFATTAGVVSGACVVVLLITSVRAIAAPMPLPEATYGVEPEPESVVASLLPHPGVRDRKTVAPRVMRANSQRSTRRRAQNTQSIVDQPIGRSANAQATVSHSSTASGTSTHSASASSSSN